ncbi:MAG: hypothetical protein DI537_59390, partial [Stutzerimonas stutzeri]
APTPAPAQQAHRPTVAIDWTAVAQLRSEVAKLLSQSIEARPGMTEEEERAVAEVHTRDSIDRYVDQVVRAVGDSKSWTAVERAAVQKAVLDGSEKAFRAYLNEYPDGRFVADARERLSALSNTARQEAKPRTDSETAIVEAERKAEQPIVDRREAYMERSTRAQAQRWLSMLGFNTYGVDGVFGSRTRSAIAAWQGSSGYRADGYLSRQQYRALRQAAQYAETRQNRQRRYQQDYDVLEGPVDGYYERYYRDDGYYNDGGGLVIIPGY